MSLDTLRRSRELERAAEDASEWQARLRQDAQFADDPFEEHRPQLGLSSFQELAELPSDDLLRAPLLRWTYWLAEQRINHWWLTHTAQLRFHAQHSLGPPLQIKTSLHELQLETLPPGPRQHACWQAFDKAARANAEAETTLWQRRNEIATHFQLEPALFAPCPDTASLARSFLERTADSLAECRSNTPYLWQNQGLGLGAELQFSAQLSPSSLADWFRQGRLLSDLRLRSWTLPKRIAPASYLRAMDELGGEIVRASAPSQQPFVIAVDPVQLHGHCFGGALASLLVNAAFLEQNLGLARKAQRDLVRSLGKSVLLEIARRAVKVLLQEQVSAGTVAFRESFAALVAEHLGPDVPPNLAGAWLRLRSDDAQRFVGALRGLAFAELLCTSHDEDWHRNPRAVEQLRSEAATPPRVSISQAEAELALDRAVPALLQLL